MMGTNNEAAKKNKKIAGTVVLMKKHVLDFIHLTATPLDMVYELLGRHITFQLVSSTITEYSDTGKGMVGEVANLEEWVRTLPTVVAGELRFKINFQWDTETQGIPGAVIVKNNHYAEFFLKALTLEDVPGKGKVHFECNSWIYPKYKYDRIFFTNETFLPSKMPAPLVPYREQELINLRGDDVPGPLQISDRVYGYDVYNDLGEPDKGEKYERPVLGGPGRPYPRRGRTSRPPTKKDRKSESRLALLRGLDVYVPRDEQFSHVRMSDFLAFSAKSIGQSIFPGLSAIFTWTPNEFNSFEHTFKLYEGGIPVPQSQILKNFRERIPFRFIREWFRSDGANVFRLPSPLVLKEDKFAWRTDEEFGREMLAGVNPIIIKHLQEFPPTSNLDPTVYGNQTSTIKEDDIRNHLEGFTVLQALRENRLFILDHHDTFMPYLPKINALKGNFIYATRTLLFLKDDGTIKPLAIELSLPHPDGFEHGAVSKVYTPATEGVDGSIWQLAKVYAAVNDSGYHQLISHWLYTHAVIEPFIIATHRQLSVTHPIHKLMSPHYRDTMIVNALARQTLINAGGIFEATVFPQKYALSMSSDIYKGWKLTEQALPDDLIKRGVAVEDPSSPYNLRLLIKDYPYAVDGLAIWSAIESWVNEYCRVYYPDDSAIKSDIELQAWWKEIREVGHGDKKDEDWWPEMNTIKDLTKTCTTIIWVASALHAAVNFGQYPYAGYLPNRPTVSRQPMPEPETKEYEELKKNPDKVHLRTITSRLQTILGIGLIELLSRHSSGEVYLGQRDTPEWTSDEKALDAFKRFRERLIGIETKIDDLNDDSTLKNRNGPVKIPYTLLYPNTSDESKSPGFYPKGIPNSVSV